MLGNVPGRLSGADGRRAGRPAPRRRGRAGRGVAGGGTTRGGVESGGGLNRLPEPNGVVRRTGSCPRLEPRHVAPVPASGSGAGTSSTLEPGSCMRACVTPSPRSGIIRSP